VQETAMTKHIGAICNSAGDPRQPKTEKRKSTANGIRAEANPPKERQTLPGSLQWRTINGAWAIRWGILDHGFMWWVVPGSGGVWAN